MNEEKLDKAKAKLMLEYPYFGSIALALDIKTNDDIESFVSDGSSFEYNDEYLKDLSIDEIEFTLANSAMHFALKHKSRSNDRVDWLWQLATDYAINDMLVKNSLYAPDRINFDKRFEGMYAEEIYAILESEIDDKEYSEQEQKKAEKEQVSPSELDGDEDEFIKQINQKMKDQGELPKDIKRFFPKLVQESIDWRSELHRYINTHAKEDYRFFPPNKRYIHQGIALPSLNSELLKIVVAIDTSGSIDESLLSVFFAHFQSIIESFNSYEIDLIECDAKIGDHRVFYPGEMIEYRATGGGGTDFRPVFEYVEDRIPDAKIVIYFTDGFGTFPDRLPLHDTLWIMPQKIDVPFGEVLEISDKG